MKVMCLVKASLFVALLMAGIAAGLSAQTIAFQRGDGVYVADGDGAHVRLVCKGNDPDISPDGMKIAYTRNVGKNRYIALYDLKKKQTRIMTKEFGTNSYGPRWSVDGGMIAFNYFTKNKESGVWQWKVAVMSSDGTDIRLLREQSNEEQYSPAWLGNDRIMFHDMQSVYITDLKGFIDEEIPFSLFTTVGRISSSIRFSPLAGGEKILFDAEVLPKKPRAAGVPSAVFVYDRGRNESTRITPKGVYSLSPCWVNDAEILYERMGKTRSIYRISLYGSEQKKLIENARHPSCSK